MVNKYELDFVQLHGNETPEFISKLRTLKLLKLLLLMQILILMFLKTI